MIIIDQFKWVYVQYLVQFDDLVKYLYFNYMYDCNEVLYFCFFVEYIEEMFLIVYMLIIGKVIEEYSYWYDCLCGIYLFIDDLEDMEQVFVQLGYGFDDVDFIVVIDVEGILGIGD